MILYDTRTWSSQTARLLFLWWFMTVSMMMMIPAVMSSSSSSSNGETPVAALPKQQQQQQQQIPVLYRYWGRQRQQNHRRHHHHHHSLTTTTTTPTSTSASIPILIVGPNVDHWKLVGQELAARGYNIMACERVPQQQQQSDEATTWFWRRRRQNQHKQQQQEKNRDAAALYILQLLDALKWKQAVLVACDSEAAMAIAATLQLSKTTTTTTTPSQQLQQRIAGLVLCGTLVPTVQEFVQAYGSFPRLDESKQDHHVNSSSSSSGEREEKASLDQYLKEHLACPFTIVWDGSIPPLLSVVEQQHSPSSEERVSSLEKDFLKGPKTTTTTTTTTRSLILGGGAAPHRRRPELFAWALTRFIEENIVNSSSSSSSRHWNDEKQQAEDEDYVDTVGNKFTITFHLDQVFSSGSLVVCGRLVATALFYAVVMKSLAFQYENIRWGMIYPIKTKYAWMRSLQKRGYSGMLAVAGRLWDGSIWRFVKSRNETEEESSSLSSSENDTSSTAAETLVREEESEETGSEIQSSSEDESVTEEEDNNTSPEAEQKEDKEEKPKLSRPHKPIFFIDQVIA